MAKRQNNIVVQKARTKFEFRGGNGYSMEEIKAVGLSVKKAREMGIRVDIRRNTCYDKNIEFLMGTYELSRQEVKPKAKSKVEKPAPEKVEPEKKAPTPKKETKPEPSKAKPEEKPVEKPIEQPVTPKIDTKTPVEEEEIIKKVKRTSVTKKTAKKEMVPEKIEPSQKPAPDTKKPSVGKSPTTEEFHKMYNEETGKNAIWRGKESGVYLKWLDQKKKDLGI